MSDSSRKETPKPTHCLEKSVEVEAPLEVAWKAISEGEELANWFPLEAEVEPGEGGSIRLSWGPGSEGTAPITAWEPLSRIEWTELMPAAAPEGGEGEGEPARLVGELQVEGRGGTTVVRVVQHGFGMGDEWDDLFDALDSGWTYFLWNLAHYLKRHPGKTRDMVWVRRKTGLARDEAWRRMFGADGLLQADAGDAGSLTDPDPGAPYRLLLDGGQSGRVKLSSPGAHFAGTVETLDDGLLFVELEMGEESWSCGIWLSTYGLAPERVRALQRDLDAVAETWFAE